MSKAKFTVLKGSLFGSARPDTPATRPSFPGCRDLEAYWQALRGDLIVPARSDFDPRGVERSLSATFIAEKVAPRVLRIRVAGSDLEEDLGMDVRGMPLTAFIEPAQREMLADVIAEVFAGPARAEVDLISRRALRGAQRARLVLLPLSDASGEITRLVGCLERIGPASGHPQRFRILRSGVTPLTGSAPKLGPMLDAPSNGTENSADSSTVYSTEPNHGLMACAEPVPSFRSKRRALAKTGKTTGHPHLRLVVSNS